jgi:hypothetical protein
VRGVQDGAAGVAGRPEVGPAADRRSRATGRTASSTRALREDRYAKTGKCRSLSVSSVRAARPGFQMGRSWSPNECRQLPRLQDPCGPPCWKLGHGQDRQGMFPLGRAPNRCSSVALGRLPGCRVFDRRICGSRPLLFPFAGLLWGNGRSRLRVTPRRCFESEYAFALVASSG